MAKRRGTEYSKKTTSSRLVLAVIGVALLAVTVLIVLSSGAFRPTVQATPLNTRLTAEGLPYKGAADAPVTIVAYSDYRCGHCRDFALETEPLIDQAYVSSGKVKFVSHYFGFSSDTQLMATAALCAAEQGKFWEFDHALFANQPSLSPNNMSVFARQIGLNMDAFNPCFQSDANRAKIKAFTRQAQAAGVQGTPTFFINGKKIVGAQPFETFSLEIEHALSGAQ